MTEEFECAECGDVLPIFELSKQSLRRSETKSRKQAVKKLPDAQIICAFCAGETEPDHGVAPRLGVGRTETELWLFSGVQLSEGMKVAYSLSN